MPWIVELMDGAVKAIDKLDAKPRQRVQQFIERKLQGADNPRQWGKALTGRYAGLWRYRLGDYRLVCQLQDARLVVLVVQVARRDKAYIGA